MYDSRLWSDLLHEGNAQRSWDAGPEQDFSSRHGADLTTSGIGSFPMPMGLNELVKYERHHRLSMLATARIQIHVPRGYTSECGEMRLFTCMKAHTSNTFRDSPQMKTLTVYAPRAERESEGSSTPIE